ncbi:MAG TPA: FKBP-type peptidyl-prolyl cis-trans isomerase N-terminal domain-containing protein, partial [Opitutaceae bacterium]|nr:FKBP-type peptidyl-prolyl cis-trans isomerase N-terminal domain-containing protein [Opitutaceae bacterium]
MSQSEDSLESVDQRVSYGIARNVGANISRQGGLEIDLSAFVVGLQDGLSGARSRVGEAELQAAFEIVQARIDAAAEKGAEKKGEANQTFLTQNKARAGVVETASGLQYEILR